MRCFPNTIPDFVAGGQVDVKKQFWKEQIVSLTKSITAGMPATLDRCDGGLYVGNAGVAYMFYYLANHEDFADMKPALLDQSMMYLKVSLEYAKKSGSGDATSFILGEAGVDAIASLIYQLIGDTKTANKYEAKYAAIGEKCLPIDFLRCGSDELFVGRAGYLCGAMNLHKKLGRKVVSDDLIKKLCSVIIQSGQRYVGKKPHMPLMYAYYKTEYLGAAHGLSSILQMLLSFPSFLKSHPDAESLVHSAVDFMLTLEQDNFNYPPAMDEVGVRRPDSEELVHWCHGAPGVVYLLARAYKYFGDEKYLQACLRCGELTWQKGLLKKGPGICHGIAGSGYVFLLLYRLTGDPKHLHRAVKFAEFLTTPMFQQHARTPDSPYSLYEGWAGTVCFLADLLQPQKAEFPLFDVIDG